MLNNALQVPTSPIDPYVDIRIRVRSSFRKQIRREALERDESLQLYVGMLLKRGYHAALRSKRRKVRQQLPGGII